MKRTEFLELASWIFGLTMTLVAIMGHISEANQTVESQKWFAETIACQEAHIKTIKNFNTKFDEITSRTKDDR